RQSLQKLTSNRTGPTKDPIVLEKLRKLEQVIDDFADRFPGRPHTIDLLLMAASANRDLDKFSDAEKYWSRTLLSEPAPGQRTLAIRGLVQARIRGGNPEEVVALTRNYLKLENWTELGPAFGYELRGILSTAAKDAGENLNKKGQMSEAGRMLLAITEEFPDLPDYDSIYRDAAYYLALGGAWGEAKHASDKYLASKDAPRSADMLYLKARAQEYQMHFADAASTHLALVEKYPRFSRSSSSVQRAEDLAIAEDDYKTAGKAALLAVQYEKGLDSRYGAYVRASSHFKHEQAWDQAIAALQEAQRISKQASTRMKTKIEMARLLAAKGDAVEAQSIYRQLAQESMKNQENIDKSLYQAVNGEANFQLAEYEKRKFDALLMSDDENPTKERLKEKATLLEKSLALYGKAIASQDPEWASRARYGAGQSAEQMSQSIRSTLAKQERSPEAGENRNLYDN
ncbi:MAG: hypothetical protein NTX25_18015, partial [Proteobacteria bacterium]|nr:hypothetical protein [Pseudomonadota bacterium]